MRSGDYLKALRERAATSRVYRKHQLDGLELARILGDERHKTLYMKLAKEQNPDTLRRLAASVADQPNVKNKGALFMYLLAKNKRMGAKTGRARPKKRTSTHGNRR